MDIEVKILLLYDELERERDRMRSSGNTFAWESLYDTALFLLQQEIESRGLELER
jgi:hypothetical protein